MTQPQPVSSTSTSRTVPSITMVSPGNTESFMVNPRRPMRPFGPVQSVTKRSSHASWLGELRKMSCTPWRSTAKW